MTSRRAIGGNGTSGDAESPAARTQPAGFVPGAGHHRHAETAQTRAEAEARYVVARDAWTAAMRRASSGKPADMASLAIAQEAYEKAALERARWHAGPRAAIRVEAPRRSSIDVAVEHELAWRRVRGSEKSKGLIGRLFGRTSSGR